MSEGAPTVPTPAPPPPPPLAQRLEHAEMEERAPLAPRPRAHRTQANFEFARRMEALLSSASSYRGAHRRRKPAPVAEIEAVVAITAAARDGERKSYDLGRDDDDHRGGGVDIREENIGEVHAGIDAVAGFELIRPHRQRPQQRDQPAAKPTRESPKHEGVPRRSVATADGRWSGPDDDERRSAGCGGACSGDGEESEGGGKAGGGAKEGRDQGSGAASGGAGAGCESKQRRVERNWQLDKERERSQLFLEQHRHASPSRASGGTGGSPQLGRLYPHHRHLNSGIPERLSHDEDATASDADDDVYVDDYDDDDDVVEEEEDDDAYVYEYDGRAGYVEPRGFPPRSLSDVNANDDDSQQPHRHHRYVDPDDEVAMAMLAGELEHMGARYPYEEEGSIRHLRALVAGGPRTPPPPIPEGDEQEVLQDEVVETMVHGIKEFVDDDDEPRSGGADDSRCSRVILSTTHQRSPLRDETTTTAAAAAASETTTKKQKKKKNVAKKKKESSRPTSASTASTRGASTFQPKRAWGVASTERPKPHTFEDGQMTMLSSSSLSSLLSLGGSGSSKYITAADRSALREEMARARSSTVEYVKSWKTNPTVKKWLVERAAKDRQRRHKVMERARADLEWVHTRREREREWHKWRRMRETDLELCRRQRISSCFRAWRSLTPGYVDEQLKRLLASAEGTTSSSSQKNRAPLSAGAAGGRKMSSSPSSSVLAAERLRLARERQEKTRRLNSSTTSSAAATGWDVDDGEGGVDDEWQVMTTAEILEERRLMMAAMAAGGASTGEKENFIEFDFACESNGPVAPTYAAKDLKAAANRKARGARHSQVVSAPGFRTGGDNLIAEADSLIVDKARHLTAMAYERAVQSGKGSSFSMLGNNKLSEVRKSRL